MTKSNADPKNQNPNQPVWSNLYPGQQYPGGPIMSQFTYGMGMNGEQTLAIEEARLRLKLIKEELSVKEYETLLTFVTQPLEKWAYDDIVNVTEILNKILNVYKENVEASYRRSHPDLEVDNIEDNLNINNIFMDIFNNAFTSKAAETTAVAEPLPPIDDGFCCNGDLPPIDDGFCCDDDLAPIEVDKPVCD